MPSPLLKISADFVEHTRRNHALEHATLHMLAERLGAISGGGRASHNGFHIYGNFEMEHIAWAANEAIRRLSAGQSRLAIHPGCGTNLVTAGLLTGGLALFMARLAGKRARWFEQLSGALLGATVGAFLAQPLGPWMQANVTTSANVQGMSVRRISHSQFGRLTVHFVETQVSRNAE